MPDAGVDSVHFAFGLRGSTGVGEAEQVISMNFLELTTPAVHRVLGASSRVAAISARLSVISDGAGRVAPRKGGRRPGHSFGARPSTDFSMLASKKSITATT